MRLTTQVFLKNSYSYLNQVVIQMDRDDVQGVEALLIKVTGSTSAYLMLNKLFYWWRHAKNLRKWVYKSWRDWANELGITRKQSGAVHEKKQLEMVGVERRRVQVAGRGTPMHYRFHFKGLLRALAKFANVSVMTIKKWMFGEKDTSACPKKAQAKHKTTRTRLQKDIVVIDNLPLIPNMKSDLIQILVKKFGFERVQAMLGYALKQGAANIAGFVMKGLHQNWDISQESHRQNPKNPWSTSDNPFKGLKWSDFAE
jgi:hypothetical protein